jgi:hypothetical protein
MLRLVKLLITPSALVRESLVLFRFQPVAKFTP